MLRNWRYIAPLLALSLLGCASHNPKPALYLSAYRYPLNSPGGKFSTLPPAVQNTIRAQTGAEPIRDIRKDSGPVYRVVFENARLPFLLIAPDGSVLNPDRSVGVPAVHEDIGPGGVAGSGLKPSDLPPNVMKVVQERAPNTEIALIQKEKAGDRDVFVVSFKDAAHNPTLRIADDGKVLNEPPK